MSADTPPGEDRRLATDRAQFATDRGRREFPTWRLGGPEVDGTFWVLDPAIAATRREPPEPAPPKPFDGLPHRSRSAVIERDGPLGERVVVDLDASP
jgi:hypothetical protein